MVQCRYFSVFTGAVQRRDHDVVVGMDEERQRLTRQTATDLFGGHSHPVHCRQVTVGRPELHQIAHVDQYCTRNRYGGNPITTGQYLFIYLSPRSCINI